MLLNIIPQGVIAFAAQEVVSEESTVISQEEREMKSEIIGEVENLRDEYTKHFRCADGSFVAAVYNEPVHYLNGEKWEEISNTLTSKTDDTLSETKNEAKYFVDKTATPITFPENINEGKITITNNDNVISFGAKTAKSKIDNDVVISKGEELLSVSIAKSDNTTSSQDKEDALIVNSDNNAITYSNVFENAYLEYEMSSSVLKESIVITKRASEYVYEFSLNLGDYVPVTDPSGGIYIYESKQAKEPVMAIAPPYMFDSDNEVSDAVTMELIQNKNDYTLVIEANANWMNSLGRNFPVVIDPTFILDVGRSAVHDIHVNQDNPNTSYKLDYQIEVGRNGNNVFRTYIKYDLPTLPDCSVVTNANLQLIQNWARVFKETDVFLNVYNCETDWDFDTIKWNNQPITDLASATVVDYATFLEGMSAVYNLNITKIVKNWYENGENYGLMLASSNESVNEKTSFYSSRNIVSNYPVVTIQYINNTGVEDYWTYEGISLDKAGSLAVNTYNGALTYVHSDADTPSLASPVNVSHVYTSDSDYGTFGNMKFGKGFKLNVLEIIQEVDSEVLSANYPYKYIDADGTVHFFRYNSSTGNYYYEFDTNIVLSKTSSGYTMSFADGSRKLFNTNGYITKTIDNNGVENVITYDNSGKIANITDGTGLKLIFYYDTDNRLTRVANNAGVGTSFSYNSEGYLTEFKYKNNRKTTLEYDSTTSLVSKITCYDGRVILFDYKSAGNEDEKFYRVASYEIYGTDGTSSYDRIEFQYRTSDTVIRNSKEDEVILAFDNTGKVINCIRNGETISVSTYNGIANNFNNPVYTSNTFTARENLAKRSGGNDLVMADNYSTSTAMLCNEVSSTKLWSNGTTPSDAYSYTTIDVEGGKTYKVSCFVNIVDALTLGEVGFQFSIRDADNTLFKSINSQGITTTDNSWVELSETIKMPEWAELCTVKCGIFDGTGTVYVEKINAEEEIRISDSFNLLKNSSFNSSTVAYLWTKSNDVSMASNPLDSTKTAIKITGKPTVRRYVSQNVSINGKEGDILVYGASAKALCSASGNNNGADGRFFGIKVSLYNDDVLKQTGYVKFNEDAWDTMQTALSKIEAQQDYNKIKYELCYNYEINSVIFDDAFLYREGFGTYYTYDNYGRLKRAEDDDNNVIRCDYSTVGDLTYISADYNEGYDKTYTYTYDSNHNVLTVTDTDGMKISYTYPTTGNKGLPLSVTVSDSGGYMKSTTTYEYYSNYRYLKSVTEPTGARTAYEYDYGSLDYGKGDLTKMTDPNGNVTEYTYLSDTTDNVSIIMNSPDAEIPPFTAFDYNESGQVKEIHNIYAVYYMDYDAFGRLEKTETYNCSNFLVNEYDNNGNIVSQQYGDAGEADFSYDEDGRLLSETYDDVLTYEYEYNNFGSLTTHSDNENDVDWNYAYDNMGRLTKASNDNGIQISYGYTDKGETDVFRAEKNGTVLSEMEYNYYDTGKPYWITMSSISDSTYQWLEYDSIGRVTKILNNHGDDENEEGAWIDRHYTYVKNGNNETDLVESLYYTEWDYYTGDDLDLLDYRYSYDANGNITHVYENDVLTNRYYYDSLDRLIREDNSHLDKTVVFNYDESGNILSKVEYPFTFGELGTSTDTIEYAYDASCSPNAVTEYDGEEIEYDDYGNPVSYRGYTMTWKKARQLATISDEDTSISFKYDSNGMRTQKTVNDVATDYIYAGTQLISQQTGNEVMNFVYSGLGEVYAVSYNGTHYFYLQNLQGDIIGLYDVNGDIVVRYTYDAWGNTVSITGPLADTIGVKNPFRYRGYYYDTETGFYYLQSRYYDPETTRFLNMDKYFIAGDIINGMNMYAYCLNNPVMYVDTTGYSAQSAANEIGKAFSLMGAYAVLIENGKITEQSFSDFLDRTLFHVSKSTDYKLRVLEIGLNISHGKHWAWGFANKAGDFLGNLLEMAGTSVSKGTLKFISLLGVADYFMNTWFNPALDGSEMAYKTIDQAWEAMVGTVIAEAGIMLAGAFTSTGHPVIGVVSGGLLIYYGNMFVEDLF